jgi:ankyrin repeat protein
MRRLMRQVLVLAALAAPAAAQTAEDGVTDIFEAVRQRDTARVEAILAPAPEAALTRDEAGRTPLMLAAYMEQTDLAAAIAARHPGPDFFESCIMGDLAAVRAALEAGEDPDAYSPDGFTCLGLAVFFHQPDIARALLDAGADPSLQARNAQTVGPVHAAVARKDVDTLALLLARGADPDAPQARGVRPIHDAAAGGNPAIVALLLMYGADAAAVTGEGKPAAELAFAAGHADLAAKLEELAAP